jgi:hypothetical protein
MQLNLIGDHCGDPVDDTNCACTHHLLFCRDILRGIGNEWANLVDMAGVQGLHVLAGQLCSIEAGPSHEYFPKHCCLQEPLLNPCYLHIGLLFTILC